MSRRKQAKPRAVLLKREDEGDESAGLENKRNGIGDELEQQPPYDDTQSTSSNSDTSTSDRSLSCWGSETGEEDSVCSTPNSLSGHEAAEVNFTIGPTDSTPYACQFCDKAFPRLSYLKKHEQSHSDQMPFQCDFCQRLFKHKRSRDRHVKLHTGDKKYRCPHCESAFSRSDHLKIHQKTHDHAKPYQCVICNRGYNTAAALTSHMQNHKKEASAHSSPSPAQFRCLQCTGTFCTGEELQAHVSTHHHGPSSTSPPADGDDCRSPPLTADPAARLMLPFPIPKVMTCIYCAKDSFSSLESLQLHVQAMHGSLLKREGEGSPGRSSPDPAHPPPLPCSFCTMKFPSLSALQKHGQSVHSLSGYLGTKENAFCAQCALAFPSSMAYAEHFLLLHANMPKAGSQGPAEPPQVRPTDLSQRRKGEGGSEDESLTVTSTTPSLPAPAPPFSLLCNQCSAGFGDFESFRSHLKSHLEEVVPKVRCEECEAEFRTEDDLETHAMTHFLATSTEYGCTSCLKLFPKPDELQKHLMDIHAHHLYKCSLCKEMFDSKVAIQVHFAVKHSNESKLFRCSACTTLFRSEMEFQVHVRMGHLRKVSAYRCLLCNSGFVTELDLQFHLSTHQKQFRCKVCDDAFHVEFLLDKHMETHHSRLLPHSSAVPKKKGSAKGGPPKDLRCDICDKGFGTEADLGLHRKTAHHISSPYVSPSSPAKSRPSNGQSGLSLHCAYCSENCKSRTELEAHMKSHQISSPGKQKCNICDELCPTPTLLAQHKLTHCKVVGGSTCTACKTLLSTEDQFYAHVKSHSGPAGLPMPCIVCRQTLMTQIEVSMHGKFHTRAGSACALCLRPMTAGTEGTVCGDCRSPPSSPKSYQCIKCQMSFGSEEEVQSHVSFHLMNEGSRHECRLCPRTHFDSPLKLQAHLIEHTFEGCPAFSCYICSTVFTASGTLQAHMLEHGLHTRPYDCPHCHLKFFFRAELQNHALSHEEMARVLRRNGTGGTAKRKKFFYRSDDSDEAESQSPPPEVKTEPGEPEERRRRVKKRRQRGGSNGLNGHEPEPPRPTSQSS